MKQLYLVSVIILLYTTSFAQWQNTTNVFTDNNHIPVSITNNDQTYPISTLSYPDSSLIIAWRDMRNGNQDIYAQKFDKNGVAQWAVNGVPVATGTENQTYYTGGTNYEPAFYSFMATDSLGGFFITWEDANTAVGNSKSKVCVQHIRSDGTLVFGAQGYTIAAPNTTDNFYYSKPQLIADGYSGFFISYLMIGTGYNKLMTYCYKDINGVLQSFGGGEMNQSLRETNFSTQCASIATLVEADLGTVADYQLFSNQQNGCGVIFRHATSVYGKEYIGTNQLIRVKKNCVVTRNPANTTTQYNNAVRYYNNYKKDSLVKLYSPETLIRTFTCTAPGNSTVYTVQSFQVTKYGFETLDNNAGASSYLSNALSYVKATSLSTYGNIVPAVFTWYKKEEATNEVPLKHMEIAYEKYDSVPYQLASDTNLLPLIVRPNNLLKINETKQTLLASGTHGYIYNYHIASGDKNVFVTAKIRPFATSATVNSMYLQKMRIYNVTSDSIEFRLESPNKLGREVAKDVNTGFQISSISLSYPTTIVNASGDAMFSVSEYYRYIRVSPVGDSCKLLWGTSGKPIGSGYVNNTIYQPQNPVASFMPNSRRAVVAWQENYRTTYTSTGENIMLRNIDSVIDNTQPARRPVSLLINAPQVLSVTLNPQVLLGNSGSYISFESINGQGPQPHSIVAEILDNTALGAVDVRAYQHNGTIRQTGGVFYLNRNYSITPTIQPSSAVTVRLFFTQAEFDALKTADPLITSINNLSVSKLAGSTAPATFPGGIAELMVIEDRQAVDGGYYLQFKVNSFSSFWIHRNTGTALPVKLNSFTSNCTNNKASLLWSTSNENNLAYFEVERLVENNWKPVIKVAAKSYNSGYSYNQAIAVTGFYRLNMVDKDGSHTYSSVVESKCGTVFEYIMAAPNPVKDVLQVTVSKQGGVLKVYNSIGILMMQKQLSTSSISIPFSNYASGIYTVVYEMKDGDILKEIIVK